MTRLVPDSYRSQVIQQRLNQIEQIKLTDPNQLETNVNHALLELEEEELRDELEALGECNYG